MHELSKNPALSAAIASRELPVQVVAKDISMSDLFRTFVAHSTQKIVDELLNANEPNEPPLTRRMSASKDIILDISGADLVHTAVIFPDVQSDSGTEWFIFQYDPMSLGTDIETYELCERLPSGLPPREFISRSHVRILSRAIEHEGEAVFIELMERGQMNRHDVLSLFAKSAEAKMLGSKIIVMPSPSPWSDCVDLAASNRPRLLVRSTQ